MTRRLCAVLLSLSLLAGTTGSALADAHKINTNPVRVVALGDYTCESTSGKLSKGPAVATTALFHFNRFAPQDPCYDVFLD